MLLSILIPAYNCEKYLDGCLGSVVEQSCLDYELILLNDGSTDGTPEKCRAWAEQYPDRIRYLSQENAGIYSTRRRLLRESRGDYLCFLDADDNYIGDDVLAKVKNVIEETDCDIVFFDATSNMNTMKRKFCYPYQNGEVFEGEKIAEIYRLFLNTKQFQHLWNKVFRRTLVDFDSPDVPFSFRMLRDGPYQFLPILSKADKIVCLNEALYFYRTDNVNSVSHSFKLEFYDSMVALHQRILEHSRNWKHKNADTDDYVKASCTADMCICAIKARNLPADAPVSRGEYLKRIGQEPLFRRQYTLKHLAAFRKPIAWALYHGQYWLVDLTSSLVGLGKSMMKRG